MPPPRHKPQLWPSVPQGPVPKLSPLVQKIRNKKESECCQRQAGEKERQLCERASLPGCGVGCSIRDMVAHMPLPPLAGGAGEGETSPGGWEAASAMLQHAKSRSA